MSNPNRAMRHEWHAPDGQIYPLVDAPLHMQLVIPPPGKEARKKALACDPNHCAIAEQHMLTADVPVAQIGIDKCYVPVKRNGKIIVYRMRLHKSDKPRIEAFDRTGEWPDDEGLILGGVPDSERLDSIRATKKRMRERWAEMGRPTGKKMTKVHLRDASRRAQVVVKQ